MITQDWNIKPRGRTCAKCAAAFADRQEYMSRLTFGDGGYERRDCCLGCWAEADRTADTLSVWRGDYAMPPPPPPEPLKKETAESLLRALMAGNEPARANAIFILAVMLERRRVLVERQTRAREDGALVRVYEHRKTGETFIVVDPRLRLDQLEPVQAEVLAMLSAPVPAAEPAAAAPAVPQPAPASGA